MIPLNIDDTTVLRRTLEELESQLMVSPPLANVDKLNLVVTPAPTNEVLAVKLNEIVGVINSITSLINSTQASELS